VNLKKAGAEAARCNLSGGKVACGAQSLHVITKWLPKLHKSEPRLLPQGYRYYSEIIDSRDCLERVHVLHVGVVS